jgi:hypothetical protein
VFAPKKCFRSEYGFTSPRSFRSKCTTRVCICRRSRLIFTAIFSALSVNIEKLLFLLASIHVFRGMNFYGGAAQRFEKFFFLFFFFLTCVQVKSFSSSCVWNFLVSLVQRVSGFSGKGIWDIPITCLFLFHPHTKKNISKLNSNQSMMIVK